MPRSPPRRPKGLESTKGEKGAPKPVSAETPVEASQPHPPTRRHKHPEPVSAGTPVEALVRGGRAASSLDNVIHQRVRLGVAAALAAADRLAFTDLKRLLDVTDGNLSVHLRKLENAGYVSCDKSFRRRRPVTRYRLTRTGRRALEEYLSHMESLIGAARAPLEPQTRT